MGLALRAVRYPIDTTLRYRPAGSRNWIEGRTVNISDSGVLFETIDGRLPPGAAIELLLEMSTLGPQVANVSCAGRIVRVETALARSLVASTIDEYRFLPADPSS